MSEVVIAAMALMTVLIGVRVFIKVRDISTWKPDEDSLEGRGGKALPQDLRDLKIDDPSENLAGLSDDPDDHHPEDNSSDTTTKE